MQNAHIFILCNQQVTDLKFGPILGPFGLLISFIFIFLLDL